MSTPATAATTANTAAVPKAAAAEVRPVRSAWLARIQAPIQGRKVPAIHQMGWYHQLLPPICRQRLV
jgi:hypothetical protein